MELIRQFFSIMLGAPFVIALLCLLSGFLAYFWMRDLPAKALALVRVRLLSVGAGMVALVFSMQIYQAISSHRTASTDVGVSDDDADVLKFPSALARSSHTGSGLAAVITYHNDNARTGQNTAETILAPANVNPAKFGRLYSYPVDGFIYAQPLYLPQVAIPGMGLHNVVFVATQHDSVYAFDADSSSPTPLWRVNFLNPEAGITPITPADVGATDIVPEIGITSTPVIDVASNTLYVVAATRENGAFYHSLHALDISSGAEKFGGPHRIQAQYPGSAQDSADGMLSFASHFQLQRAALLLSKGQLYIAFASYGDAGLYHGWVIAYDPVRLTPTASWVTTPNGYQGGIWMSGCGISADSAGDLYLSTANGPFDAFGESPGTDFSDSIVKLQASSNGLKLVDFFTPFNQLKMAAGDLDLGSSGVVLLPDQPGPYPHLAVTTAKDGHIYLLNRDALGGYSGGEDRNLTLVQEIAGKLKEQLGTPAYWNGYVYFGSGVSPQKDSIRAFSLSNGVLSRSFTSQTAAVYQVTRNTVSVSANQADNGIVWAVQTDGYYAPGKAGPAILHAYDARNLAHELYNSNQRAARDNPGSASKFTVPTVVSGKVFVGTADRLSVYGLLSAIGAGN